MSKALIFSRHLKTKFGNNCIGFFQITKVNLKWPLSEIVYISKSVKKITPLTAEKFGNINLYQHTVLFKIIYDWRIKFLLWKNVNFWFQKNSIQICIFSCNKCIFWGCGWSCLYHKDSCRHKLQYKHYNSVLIS